MYETRDQDQDQDWDQDQDQAEDDNDLGASRSAGRLLQAYFKAPSEPVFHFGPFLLRMVYNFGLF